LRTNIESLLQRPYENTRDKQVKRLSLQLLALKLFINESGLAENLRGTTGGEEKGVQVFRAVSQINHVKAGLEYLLRARMSITKTLKVRS
jgi:hypothetical protein